jgi:hypothetical protein
MKEQINESQLVGIYVVYTIIKKLCTPFDQTDAYKLGIIDKEGNVLRPRRTLKTRQEREAYTVLDTLIFNIKRMIERLPGGKTRIASYAAALWLIKEAHNHEAYAINEEMMETELVEFITGFQVDEETKKNLALVDMAEDIANVGGAGVATDVPFKPKVKEKPEDLSKKFLKMYEELRGLGLVGHASKEEVDPVIGKMERRK